jgi:hypothetical protein
VAVYLLKLAKPAVVGALVGLVAVHFVAPLDAATIAVAALWVLLMIFVG